MESHSLFSLLTRLHLWIHRANLHFGYDGTKQMRSMPHNAATLSPKLAKGMPKHHIRITLPQVWHKQSQIQDRRMRFNLKCWPIKRRKVGAQQINIWWKACLATFVYNLRILDSKNSNKSSQISCFSFFLHVRKNVSEHSCCIHVRHCLFLTPDETKYS